MAGLITASRPRPCAPDASGCARRSPAARRAGRDPADVELLAAVKYVALEELGALAEAGARRSWARTARRTSRPRPSAHPSFRWHFIGQLQSRKVKQILPHVELIHSVA